MQTLVTQVAAMTTSLTAVPPLLPYIVAEAAEGAAYQALPSPKSSVLNGITATVADLDARFTKVSHTARFACLQSHYCAAQMSCMKYEEHHSETF